MLGPGSIEPGRILPVLFDHAVIVNVFSQVIKATGGLASLAREIELCLR